MARAVVGGLITSTLLTLIVVPVVYTILDDITAWMFRRNVRPGEGGGARPGARGARGRRRGDGLGADGAGGGLAEPAGHADVAGCGDRAGRAGGRAGAGRGGAQAAPKVLTLEEALALAAAKNRDIQKAIEYQKWVQGQYLEERASAMPQATFARRRSSAPSTTRRASCSRCSAAAGSDGGEGGFDIGEIFSGRQDIGDRAVHGDAGALHVGPGGRRHPRREARVRHGRPAAPPVPPGRGARRHRRLLRRAGRARAGEDRRAGPRRRSSATWTRRRNDSRRARPPTTTCWRRRWPSRTRGPP